MSVVIRLSRVGTKHVPFYRVVVADSRKKRDGAILENLGTYNAEKTELVCFNPDRFDAWVKVGAQPSETAKKLYRLYKLHGATEQAKNDAVVAETTTKAPRAKKTAAGDKAASEPKA